MKCPNWVQSAALAKPEGIALEFLSRSSCAETITHFQLLQEVRKAAQILVARRGDLPSAPSGAVRIGLFGPPSLEWITILHAVGWLGWEAVLLPSRAPPSELQEALSQAPPLTAVYVTAQASSEVRVALADKVSVWDAGEQHLEGHLRSSESDRKDERHDVGERFWPLDEVRVWIRSSGTTATPHFVPLTTGQIYFAAMGSTERLGHLTGDVWLNSLPLEHVGGLSILFRAVIFAVSVRILHPFCASTAVAQLIDGNIALVSWVPQMLQQALHVWPKDAGPNRLLRAVLVGGGPSEATLLKRARALGLPAVATWGMTETAAQVATVRPGDEPDDDRVGPPLVHARVRSFALASEVGALEVWTPGMDAPLTTRDLGRVKDRGVVYVHGRLDDLIISGGMKILPREVETALESHPGVSEACVVGRPDEKWGMRPVAFLVAQKGTMRPSDDALKTYCRKLLANYKTPTHFNWREELPRDQLGKLRRRSVK